MSRIRTIVHPTDFSRASMPAFKRAVELAKDNRAQLVVVHVLAPAAPVMMADGYVSPKVYEDMEAAARAGAQKELRKLKTVAERKEHLDKIDARRGALNKEAVDLDTKRQEFIRQELARRGKGKGDSFDASVLDMIRRQAKKHGIDY